MGGQRPKAGEKYVTFIVATKDNDERVQMGVQHRYLWERGLYEWRTKRDRKRQLETKTLPGGVSAVCDSRAHVIPERGAGHDA